MFYIIFVEPREQEKKKKAIFLIRVVQRSPHFQANGRSTTIMVSLVIAYYLKLGNVFASLLILKRHVYLIMHSIKIKLVFIRCCIVMSQAQKKKKTPRSK